MTKIINTPSSSQSPPPSPNKNHIDESLGWIGRHIQWIKGVWNTGSSTDRLGIGLLTTVEIIATVAVAFPGWIILGMGCYELYQQSKAVPLSERNIEDKTKSPDQSIDVSHLLAEAAAPTQNSPGTVLPSSESKPMDEAASVEVVTVNYQYTEPEKGILRNSLADHSVGVIKIYETSKVKIDSSIIVNLDAINPEEGDLQPSPELPIEKPSKSSASITVSKIVKFVAGAFLLGGSAIASTMLTGQEKEQDVPLGNRAFNDEAFDLAQHIEETSLNLQGLEEPVVPFALDANLRYVSELNKLSNELAVSVSNEDSSSLEALAKKVQEVSNKAAILGEAIKQHAPAEFSYDAPIVRLCSVTPASPIHSNLLLNVLSDSWGGAANVEFSSPIESVNYMIDRVESMGSNAEQISLANMLHESLKTYPEFIELHNAASQELLDKVQAAQTTINHHLKKLDDFQKEKTVLNTNDEYDDQNEQKKLAIAQDETTLFDEIHKVFQELQRHKDERVNVINQFLAEKMAASNSRGFFIPSATDGGVIQFIPKISGEPPKNSEGTAPAALHWDLRLFRRIPFGQDNLSYHPYQEMHDVPINSILAPEFIDALSGFSTSEYSTSVGVAKLPNDVASAMPKIDDRGALETICFPMQASPPYTSPLDNSIQFTENPQNVLRDVLYVELGPEALLDYQISTIKHYLDASRNTLDTDPRSYTALMRSLAPLANAVEKGGREKWINPKAVSEKSKVIHDSLNALKRIAIKMKKRARENAPSLVNETIGLRKTVQGEIPNVASQISLSGQGSLSEQAVEQPSKPYKDPLQLVPNVGKPEVISSNLLDAQAITDLVGKFKDSTQQNNALAEFHSWANYLLSNIASVDNYTPEESNKMINDLLDISSLLTSSSTSTLSQDKINSIAIALTEAVAIGDLLMQKADSSKLSGNHLPLPQFVRQLQNQGLFGQHEMIFPLLNERSSHIQGYQQLFIFAEGIYYDSDKEKHSLEKSIWTGSSDSYWKRYESRMPWTYFKLLLQRTLDVEFYGRTATGDSSFEIILQRNKELIQPGTSTQLRKMVRNTAAFTASVLTDRVSQVNKKIKESVGGDPQLVIDAVSEWSQHLNPSSIAVTTLEMLSEDQRNTLLSDVSEIAQNYFAALFLTRTGLPSPENMITLIELLTFADQVMAYSLDQDKTLFHLPIETFREIIDGKNPFFRTFDPHMDGVRIAGIKAWMDERTLLHPDDESTRNHDTSSSPYNPVFTGFRSFFKPEPYSTSKSPLSADVNSDLSFAYYLSHISNQRDMIDFRKIGLTGEEFKTYSSEYSMTSPEEEYSMKVLNQALQGYVDPQKIGSNSKAKTLPSWFYHIRNLVFMAQHTLHSGFPNPLGENATVASFEPTVKTVSTGDHIAFKQELPGVGLTDLANYPEIPDGQSKETHFAHLEPHTDENLPKDIRQTWLIQPPLLKENNTYLNSIPSFNVVAENMMHMTHRPSPYDLNTVMGKDVEPFRRELSTTDYIERMTLRGEPILQTFLTISKYLEEPVPDTPGKQLEFLSLLFTPGFLNEHLKTPEGVGPASEKDLFTYIRTHIRLNQNNKELTVFLTELAVRLQGYSELARTQAPEVYQNHPFKKEFKELCNLPKTMLARQDLTVAERSSYSALRALNFLTKKELSPDETVEFIQAVINYRSFSPLPMVNEIFIQKQIDQLLKRFTPNIEKVLYPNGLDQPLSHPQLSNILKGVLGEDYISSIKPSAADPFLFSDEKGTIQVNVLKGTIIQSGREGITLPSEVRLSTPYQMVFGNRNYRAKAIDRYSFEFVDEQGSTNRMQKNQDGSWSLLRRFVDSSNQFRFVSHEWSEFDSVSKTQRAIPWLKSKLLLNKHSQWYWGGNNPEIRLVDPLGHSDYRVQLGGREGKTIQGVFKTKGKEILQLADSEQSAYKWTSQFEDPIYTHVWLSNQQGRHIEFPRVGTNGLSFTWNKKGWSYDSDPKFYVVDPQTHPIFPGQNNFLHLKSKNRAEKILMPRLTPQLNPDGALAINTPFDRITDNPNTRIKLLTLEKNPKTKLFEGTDPESNLYLAMMHFSHRDYTRAFSLINSLAGHNQRFSPEEMQILDWIISGDLLPPDENSQAIGIKTAAAYLKMRNLEKHSVQKETPPLSEKTENVKKAEKPKEYDVPQALKVSYFKVMNELHDLRLPSSDEALLFEDLIRDGMNRPLHETLVRMELTNPIAAREALDKALTEIFYKKQCIQLDLTLADGIKDKVIPVSTEPLPLVITKEELEKLVTTQSNPLSGDIPNSLKWIFDFESERFRSLPAPTQEELRQWYEGVKVYQASRDSNTYRLKDVNAVMEKRIFLESQRDALANEMEFLKVKILSLANPRPQTQSQIDALQLKIAKGSIEPVSLNRLLGIYQTNDIRGYTQLNPALDIDAAQALDTELQKYIDRVPDLRYHQRLIDAMREIEKLSLSSDPSTPSEDLQQALKEFVSATKMGRQFPPEANRLMKVMEFQTGTYYRAAQVDNLAKMGFAGLPGSIGDKNTSSVHWITVGAGKTSYLIPSLCRSITEQGKLCLVVMPQAQISSAGGEFSAIMKDVYGVTTQVIEFTREHDPLNKMENILKQVTEAIEKGNPVLTSGSSLKSLILELKEHSTILAGMYADKTISPEKLQKQERLVLTLQKLVNSFDAKAIIDELHQEYARRIEKNYPSGEARPLPLEYGVLTLNLYEILRDDPEIQALMHFDFIPQKRIEDALPFSEKRFKLDIAPIIVEKLLTRIMNDSTDTELLPLKEFLSKHVNKREDIKKYLLKSEEPGFKEISAWVKGLDPSIRDQLALIRGQLNVLLPTTLDKNFREKYGYENDSDILPTPFSAADTPNKGSKNKSPFEQIDYLLQALFRVGVRKPMIDRIVYELRQERAKELYSIALSGNIPIGQRINTQADTDFQRLFSCKEYTLDTPQLEELLMKKVGDNPEQLRHLVKAYALPLVKVFPRNLKATSDGLGNLFKVWIGLSGTPDNYPTYPGNFTPPEGGAVVGRMLSLISELSVGKLHVLKATDRKSILLSPPYVNGDAFIDAGGVFATEDVSALAAAWGKQTGKSFVTVDPERGVIIRQHADDKKTLLRDSSVPPNARVTIYPQPNIVGTDIPQKKNGVGFVSISKGMTYTELEQAAGRMRGIELGQGIELLVIEEDAIVIREKLGLAKDHSLTSEEVIFYLKINQSDKGMDNGELSLHQEIPAVLENFVFNSLKTSDILTTLKKTGAYELLNKLFYSEVSVSPYELFGKDDEVLDSQVVFNAKIDKLLGQGEASKNTFTPLIEQLFGSQTVKDLRAEMQFVVSKKIKYVKPQINSQPNDVGIDEEQELLSEQEQEQEVSIEQELEAALMQENMQGPKPAREVKDYTRWKNIADMCTWNFWQNNNANLQGTTFDLFDEHLKLSTNYQYAPIFTAPQKPVQMMMIVKNKQTGEHRFILLDPKDAKDFKLTYDALKPEQRSNTDAEIWLGHVDGRKLLGNLYAGKLSESGLDPESQHLWWQAKIFAGRINHFTPDQNEGIKNHIEKWVAAKVVKEGQSREYWLKNAEDGIKKLLVSKEDVVAGFPRSSLGKIFSSCQPR